MARLRTSLFQASRSLCTSAVSWTCIPVALLRACCTRVNMLLDPATAGMMLQSIPRSLRHLCREVDCAFLGMPVSAAATFSCCIGGRHITWAIMTSSHPRNVFLLDRAPYTCLRFFWEMGYLRLVFALPLAGNLLRPSLRWGKPSASPSANSCPQKKSTHCPPRSRPNSA